MTVEAHPCDISQDSSTEHLLAYPMVDAERARKRTVSMRDLYQVWSSALSAKEIEDITTTAMRQASQEATTFSAETEIQDKRSCTIRWLPDQWIKDLLWTYVQQANQDAFHIDVDNHAEMQFTEYRATQGDHYDWHHDVQWTGQAPQDRKLSVTVQLSDGASYGGGDFEFDEVQTNADFRSKGTVLIFPSYLRHRVQPVTAGTRRALVAWFFGPRWR